LRSFLAELSRYRSGHLGCDDAVAAIRVSGAFPLDDIEQTLLSLTESFPGNVIEQAAQWHAHLQSGEVSPADRSAFEAWRVQQPAHAEAYARMTALWQRFDALKDGPAASTVGSMVVQSLSAKSSRRRKAAGLLSLLLVIGVGTLGLNTATGDYLLADYSTRTG